jgi:hypothetical protein
MIGVLAQTRFDSKNYTLDQGREISIPVFFAPRFDSLAASRTCQER